MRRTPTAILAAATVTVGLLGLVLAPDVAGARLASTAKGTTMCFVSGTITASPALTLGSGKATTLTFSARLQGCTGTNASNIMHLSAKVSYKTISGSMAQTKLAFSAGTLNYTAMPLSISYPKHGGKGVATGSFATKHASLMLNLSVPYTEWVSTCQSPTGLASMTIVSTSSATL